MSDFFKSFVNMCLSHFVELLELVARKAVPDGYQVKVGTVVDSRLLTVKLVPYHLQVN